MIAWKTSQHYIRTVASTIWKYKASSVALLMVLGTLFAQSSQIISADGPGAAQLQLYANGISAFDIADDCAPSGATDSAQSVAAATGDAGHSGTWNSGLQPPFILEQFAIETIKDVATKMGSDPTAAVTQEHVIALVAFMFGEGGDIANHDLFNPLNTGINAPDLLATGNSASGLQSFKSFDAGVEATARTMVLPTQNRLANVLIQPTTTAQDFMKALTYFKNYDGNAFWAAASKSDPDGYYTQRLNLVQQVRSSYADIAGLEIGTPAKEEIEHLTDKAKLQFHPTGDTSSTTDTGGTGGSAVDSSESDCSTTSTAGVVQNNIAKTALGLAWPNHNAAHNSNGGADSKAKSTPAYQVAMPKFDHQNDFTDCGVFVATVMRSSGVDPNYPEVGTGIQLPYLRSHPSLYKEIPNVQSTADITAGDIMITDYGEGHTYIYTGPYKGDDGKSYNAAGASLTDHVPEATNFFQAPPTGNNQHFVAFQFIGSGSQPT